MKKIEILSSQERGHAQHGWLDSRHTFSFAGYRNPEQMHFSDLRVINDDWIDGGYGFPTHPHDNMEIFTYVLEGALEHKDSMGNGERINPGDVQLMSAGSGVRHSEYNPLPNTKTNLLQIWMFPNEVDGAPSYQQKYFSPDDKRGVLKLIISGNQEDGSLKIKQTAKVYAGLFDGDESAILQTSEYRSYFIHVARGSVKINGLLLNTGDALKIFSTDENIEVSEGNKAEVLIFNLNKHRDYRN